jgi:hypothetical protein
LVYFGAVKLAGYTVAGRYLNSGYEAERPRPIVFGLARTALGFAVGIPFALTAAQFDIDSHQWLWYVCLAPLRLGEWLLAIWYFYNRVRPSPRLGWYTSAGILWSFVLDLPAVTAMFVLPGGVWIC